MVYHSSGLESPYPKCTLCAGWHSHWIPSHRVCTPFYLELESHEIPAKVVHESEPNGAQCTEILTVCAPAKGCGSNVSLSNIKNLLLHAYEFQYLWPSIKRSTVRGRLPLCTLWADGQQYGTFTWTSCGTQKWMLVRGRVQAPHLEF